MKNIPNHCLPLAFAFATALFVVPGHAQLTVIKLVDPAPNVSVNNTSNSTQQFTFTLADMGGNGAGLISDVSIALTFAKNRGGFQNLNAAWFNEVGFTLSYGAASVQLIVGDSALINNQASFLPGLLLPSFSGTIVFDDEAANSLGTAPVSGAFRPVGSLAAFDGLLLSPGNTWTLTIRDTATTGGAVIFDKATLTVGFMPVPEPATYGIIGTAMLAVLIGFRRYKSGRD